MDLKIFNSRDLNRVLKTPLNKLFRYTTKLPIHLSMKSERNVKRFDVALELEWRQTKALSIHMRHRKQRLTAVMWVQCSVVEWARARVAVYNVVAPAP